MIVGYLDVAAVFHRQLSHRRFCRTGSKAPLVKADINSLLNMIILPLDSSLLLGLALVKADIGSPLSMIILPPDPKLLGLALVKVDTSGLHSMIMMIIPPLDVAMIPMEPLGQHLQHQVLVS